MRCRPVTAVTGSGSLPRWRLARWPVGWPGSGEALGLGLDHQERGQVHFLARGAGLSALRFGNEVGNSNNGVRFTSGMRRHSCRPPSSALRTPSTEFRSRRAEVWALSSESGARHAGFRMEHRETPRAFKALRSWVAGRAGTQLGEAWSRRRAPPLGCRWHAGYLPDAPRRPTRVVGRK